MKNTVLSLAALLVSVSAFAAQDCSKFNNQISYGDSTVVKAVDQFKDIAAGKITASVRMYSDRCEAVGQTLDVVYSKDPVDPATNKRKAQLRVLVTKVTKDVAFAALSDANAKAQGFADANALRAFLTTVYTKDDAGQPKKDKDGKPVDPSIVTKETWTVIEFKAAK